MFNIFGHPKQPESSEPKLLKCCACGEVAEFLCLECEEGQQALCEECDEYRHIHKTNHTRKPLEFSKEVLTLSADGSYLRWSEEEERIISDHLFECRADPAAIAKFLPRRSQLTVRYKIYDMITRTPDLITDPDVKDLLQHNPANVRALKQMISIKKTMMKGQEKEEQKERLLRHEQAAKEKEAIERNRSLKKVREAQLASERIAELKQFLGRKTAGMAQLYAEEEKKLQEFYQEENALMQASFQRDHKEDINQEERAADYQHKISQKFARRLEESVADVIQKTPGLDRGANAQSTPGASRAREFGSARKQINFQEVQDEQTEHALKNSATKPPKPFLVQQTYTQSALDKLLKAQLVEVAKTHNIDVNVAEEKKKLAKAIYSGLKRKQAESRDETIPRTIDAEPNNGTPADNAQNE